METSKPLSAVEGTLTQSRREQLKWIYQADCTDYVNHRRAELQSALDADPTGDEARIILAALQKLPEVPVSAPVPSKEQILDALNQKHGFERFVAAPVPEPEPNGKLDPTKCYCPECYQPLGSGPCMKVEPEARKDEPDCQCGHNRDDHDEWGYCDQCPCENFSPDSPARKDELGTCDRSGGYPLSRHNEPHTRLGCVNWRPVPPQPSPEACNRCGLSLVDWFPVINIRQGIGFHISRIDETRPQLRCETSMSCLICGQVRDKAIVHEPSGAYVCMECRESARRGQVPSPEAPAKLSAKEFDKQTSGTYHDGGKWWYDFAERYAAKLKSEAK